VSETVIYALEFMPEIADREFRILATRQNGKRFAEQLQAALANSKQDVATRISFANVHLMDASFADEVFGVIGVSRSEGKTNPVAPFYIGDLEPTSLENLNMALDSRIRRHKALRNCIMPVLDPEGDLKLVGKSEDHVEQTFELLRLSKELTTPNVATVLKLSDAAASTRLKVLYDLGLALRSEVRDEQGRQFVYRWLL
jgi:hypothetical protein